MPVKSFNKLLGLIRKDLEVDRSMASLRGGAIIPEICLYCTLRYLAGGSYSDIHFFVGISSASFYRVVQKTLRAINKCKELRFRLPKTKEELRVAAEGFESISSNGCIKNCVGVVDGYHLQTQSPSKKEAGNVRSFFSGHYQTYGVNCQAVADHHCRFTFFAVAGPGVLGDRNAINEAGLGALINELPGLYCVIGDCAYTPSEHLVPIYGGKQALTEVNDNFNFYASQCRIRIEMAFGLMVKKWGILGRAMSLKLKYITPLILAVSRLHNFCINERLMGKTHHTFTPKNVDLSVHAQAMRQAAADFECDDMIRDFAAPHSLNRERMAKAVADAGLERPGRSVLSGRKRKRNQQASVDV